MSKTLIDFTYLSGARGSIDEVRAGDEVHLIDSQNFNTERERRIQQSMNDRLLKEMGVPPYKILEINRYPSGMVLLLLEGPTNKKEEITRDYFTKV